MLYNDTELGQEYVSVPPNYPFRDWTKAELLSAIDSF